MGCEMIDGIRDINIIDEDTDRRMSSDIEIFKGTEYYDRFLMLYSLARDIRVDYVFNDSEIFHSIRPLPESFQNSYVADDFCGSVLDKVLSGSHNSDVPNFQIIPSVIVYKYCLINGIQDSLNKEWTPFSTVSSRKASDTFDALIDSRKLYLDMLKKAKKGSFSHLGKSIQDILSKIMSIPDEIKKYLSQRASAMVFSVFDSYLSHLDEVSGQPVKAMIDEFIIETGEFSYIPWIAAFEAGLREDIYDVVRNRIQAHRAYLPVAEILMRPEITSRIDNKEPIADIVATTLHMTKFELQTILKMHAENRDMESYDKFLLSTFESGTPIHKIKAISDYNLQLTGEKDGPRRIKQDVVMTFQGVPQAIITDRDLADTMISFMKYIMNTSVQFIVHNVKTDDVIPDQIRSIFADGIFSSLRFCADNAVRVAEGSLEFLNARRVIQKAITGNRSLPKLVSDIRYCHEFMAAIEEIWSETDDMAAVSWVALTKTWTSGDGRFSVVPLTTAGSLVKEGLEMRHCVGGYADQCRSGRSHIYSVRVDGKRAGTLEMGLDGATFSKLVFCQFKGFANSRPDGPAQQAVREFHQAITSKAVKLNITGIRKQAEARPRLRPAEDTPADLDKQFRSACNAWEIYRRTLLPKERETSLPEWLAKTGIRSEIEKLFFLRYAEYLESEKRNALKNCGPVGKLVHEP